MKLSNLKVATRLWVGFSILMAFMATLTAVGVLQMRTMDAAFENVQRAAKNEKLAMEIGEGINNMRRYQLSSLVSTGAERMKELERVTAQGKASAKLAAELEKFQRGVDTKKIAGDLLAAVEKYAQGNEQVIRLAREDKADEMKALIQGDERKIQRASIAEVEKFQAIQESRLAAADKLAEEAQKKGELLMYALVAGALLLAIVIAVLISRSITVPVGEAVRVAEALAQGDLTLKVEAKSKDELGRLMDALGGTVVQLSGIVGRIKETSDMVSTASREIAQGNSDLSTRTEEQASALEETSASMQQMTATVSQNAENAKKANELAAQASGVAAKGGEVVREAVGTMNGITAASKKIADIIGVIDGIAFQTNILALNAAVEAARAGEQGRGFAVVASEVRSLAQRSAAAAKEIKDLITDSAAKVDAGSRQVNDAGRTMEEIVASVKKVTTLIAEITAASQEQAQGIEQVSETMTQMEKVTQQNAAMVEEASAAAGSLEEQSHTLADAVRAFKLNAEHRPIAPAAKPVEAKKPVEVKKPGEAKKPELHAVPAKAVKAKKGNGHLEEGWQQF